MGIIGGDVGYRLLCYLSPKGDSEYVADQSTSRIEELLGAQIWNELKDKVVLDYGCESGLDAIEIARHGARKVIGVDTNEHAVGMATKRAEREGVGDRCVFTTRAGEDFDGSVDVIVSIDAFEHFADPAGVLRVMRRLLKPEGYVITTFGPIWYHPLGGHAFSIFPWAHLVFTEKALLRWHRDWSKQDATRFGEIRGGLNQMTIKRFLRTINESEFQFESFETVPIRRLRLFANRLTREFTTALIKCKLVPRSAS
ncbi:MAG TPA: class I SAM-dependent methyltransferase [Pyrinomonadaceae bacterium]|jgi:2-polyprenyl-3-methyl-5-hydroxy-6-metoxy-1,4-benzoquinol methylase